MVVPLTLIYNTYKLASNIQISIFLIYCQGKLTFDDKFQAIAIEIFEINEK